MSMDDQNYGEPRPLSERTFTHFAVDKMLRDARAQAWSDAVRVECHRCLDKRPATKDDNGWRWEHNPGVCEASSIRNEMERRGIGYLEEGE